MELNPMVNPFEYLSKRLELIESTLNEVNVKLSDRLSISDPNLSQIPDEGDIELAIKLTGLERGTIYNYVNHRTIPHKKVGAKLVFVTKELIEWNTLRTTKRSIRLK